ncbi:ChaN family lipoprotein [Marinospirillum sp. MEB164]|uniref:ChaN family lipoprotein n=1 Tax=Marinospirillum alkalitolerans TaxID=3123374 RepID=A0ABW8Q0I7_9GAMM
MRKNPRLRSRRTGHWLGCCLLLSISGWLSGCQALPSQTAAPSEMLQGRLWSVEQADFVKISQLLAELPAGSWLLVGEQHDHPEHQQWAQRWIEDLAAQGRLGAVAFEMAHYQQQAALDRALGQEQITPEALEWVAAWPWDRYQSVVETSLRLAPRVVGADLTRAEQLAAYREGAPQAALSPAQAAALDQLIDEGHCQLLPPERLPQMRQVQLARDQQMAAILSTTPLNERIGVFLAGSVHQRPDLGVPRWLAEGVQSVTVRLVTLDERTRAEAYLEPGVEQRVTADYLLFTAPLPAADYCAELRAQFQSTHH